MEIIRNKEVILFIDKGEIFERSSGQSFRDLHIPYIKIVEKLGKPTSKSDNYKITAEWLIVTPHGVGSIYDWKTSKKYLGSSGISVKNTKEWEIRGENETVVDFIEKIFYK